MAFRQMNHHDLLDAGEAFLMEPLVEHPEEFRKFREEVLYAPLEGSKKAKQRAQRAALAGMGIDIDTIKAGQGLGRTARAHVAKAEKAKEAEKA